MKEYVTAAMKACQAYIDNDMKTASEEKTRRVLAEFEIKISYFQHERLIHLIVTVLFAVLEIMAISVCLISPQLAAVVFSIMFLVLLVPYVMHYYFLENSVQKMYHMRDEIRGFLNSSKII